MSNRLTIKGQVTIPKEVRDFLGLTSGNSAIEFTIGNDGVVRVIKAQPKPRRPIALGRECREPANACDRILALLSGQYA